MKYIIILLILTSCEWLEKNYPPDNAFEEISEDIIRSETGIDTDLSPSTPEPRWKRMRYNLIYDESGVPVGGSKSVNDR